MKETYKKMYGKLQNLQGSQLQYTYCTNCIRQTSEKQYISSFNGTDLNYFCELCIQDI